MFAVLAAALVLNVPYVPQTDALCGGAAAAMVFRYWGDAHAGVQAFAPLVDRRAGGIADDVLVQAIADRGWMAQRVDGSLDALAGHLARGEPSIVLLSDRGTRYHYVVVVGRTANAVIVHDPSWGPNRAIRDAEFDERWKRSGRWTLIVRPSVDAPVRVKPDTRYGPKSVVSGFSRTDTDMDACDALLDRAVADVGKRGLASADEILGAVRTQCPQSAGPLRELAGVRFAERRWRDAASLARQAVTIDPGDSYALDVLGSSLFMLDDPVGALRAWNHIGKPILDRVVIAGIRHSRYQAIASAIRLTSGAVLTADAFEQARRRVDELPDRATARLDVRPDADGYAAVDVVIAERSSIPSKPVDWMALGVQATVDRELTSTLPGFTGQGDTWSASWRWWANRPRASLEFAAPHIAGLPGIWRVSASWEAESYSFADTSPVIRNTRSHADLSIVDWMSADWRYTMRGGVDDWNDGRRGGFVGGELEHRLVHDRVSLSADADAWLANASSPAFSSTSLRARWTSPPAVSGWTAMVAAGVQHVTDAAPLDLWPGAGEGQGRVDLLRAHPLLDDGVIRVTSDTAFGRTLAFGSAEAQRWIETRWPVRVGVAAFTDVARASDRAMGAPTTQIDVGSGLRLRLPGMSHTLRVDVAHGLRDGANALTVGWIY